MRKKKQKRIKGTLSKHARGYGFVIPEDKDETKEKDIFIPRDEMSGAMNDDKVEVRIINQSGTNLNREGTIEKVLKRANKEVVGTLITRGDHGYIIPAYGKETDHVLISKKNFKGAKSGDKVVADMIRWPKKGRPAEANVKEVISKKGDPGGDIKALIRAFGVHDSFTQNVRDEAENTPQQIREADLEGRRDLRDETIITIDGADAKDLDDGVSVKRLNNGNYLLGVHIADVSHYVKEDSDLDKEALRRGTSIYLIDWVVPMLPVEISNGICSLNPNEDRLALSVSMEIDKTGKVVSYDIYKSIIRSTERMVYTDVSDMLEKKNDDLIRRFEHVYSQILQMNELAGILKKRRNERGSIDFDIGESYITLDQYGFPVEIREAERRIANSIIEEFMLITNETIATHFSHLELPFIFRTHEKPASDKIAEFKKFLTGIGLVMKGNADSVHPKALNEILTQVQGSTKEKVVNTVMLRSMKKASYGVECLGHFGLGLEYYCHFTAPIRRYADLYIHRVIKEFLDEKIYGKRIDILKEKAQTAADNSSVMERKAEELEREVERLKKVEYMSSRIGDNYDGIISGIASFGFFVELENTVEGLVRIDSIYDDYYIYEPDAYRFIGENTKKVYSLGKTVNITVDSVDVIAKEINFAINDPDSKRKG